MKKICLKKGFRAFSLAEALITLLIVCLITIASIPILTKKRRDPNAKLNSGVWICYRTDTSPSFKSYFVIKGEVKPGGEIASDNHSMQRAIHGYAETGIFSGAGCKFNPPSNTKNYVITNIGGGGGGAAAYSEITNETMGNDTEYTIPYDGTYAFLLSSAGGSGGPINDYGSGSCDNNGSENVLPGDHNKSCGSMGAPGAFIIKNNVHLKQNDTIRANYPTQTWFFGCSDGAITNFGSATMKYNGNVVWSLSSGQSGGCADYDGYNKWRGVNANYEAVRPSTGSNSGNLGTHLKNLGTLVYGGNVGSFGTGPFTVTPSSHSNYSLKKNLPAWLVSSSPTAAQSGSSQKYPMKSYNSDYEWGLSLFGFSSAQDFYGNYGHGGQGEQDDHGGRTKGGVGTARMAYTSSYSGLGGYAGEMKPSQIVSSLSSGIWAYPGEGGKGGTLQSAAGSGFPTYVDRYPVANGGAGAPMVNKNQPSSYCQYVKGGGKAIGCEGERSQTYHTIYSIKNYGGLAVNNGTENGRDGQPINIFPVNNRFPHAAGMGGAGGGAGGTDEVTADPAYIGLGGQGASGAVVIEW